MHCSVRHATCRYKTCIPAAGIFCAWTEEILQLQVTYACNYGCLLSLCRMEYLRRNSVKEEKEVEIEKRRRSTTSDATWKANFIGEILHRSISGCIFRFLNYIYIHVQSFISEQSRSHNKSVCILWYTKVWRSKVTVSFNIHSVCMSYWYI